MNYPPCPSCGGQKATLNSNNQYCCDYCGHVYSNNAQQTYQNVSPNAPYAEKDKTIAGILAILLGIYGAHYFYLGKPLVAVIYLLFWWSSVPFWVGVVEGALMLMQSDAEFKQKPKAFFL